MLLISELVTVPTIIVMHLALSEVNFPNGRPGLVAEPSEVIFSVHGAARTPALAHTHTRK